MSQLGGCVLLVTLTMGSASGVTLLDSFNAGLGTLNGIAYDASSDLLYVHQSFGADISELMTDGSLIGTIPHPGASTNDSDYSVSTIPSFINGTLIPAGTLLVTNGEIDPQTLFAVDIASGLVLDSITLAEPIGQLTGGSLDPTTGQFVTIDWSNDLIIKFNANNGAQLTSFDVGIGWDAFYSDVEVGPNGFIYLVSDSQNSIRVLNNSGAFVKDFDVGGIGISGMSGLAIDPNTYEGYISSTNGNVYHVDGLDAVPEPQTWALIGLGTVMIGWTFRRRLFGKPRQ